MSNKIFGPVYDHMPLWRRRIALWRDATYAPQPGYLPPDQKERQQIIGGWIGWVLVLFLALMILPPFDLMGMRTDPVLKSVSAHIFHAHLGLWFSVLLYIAVGLMIAYMGESFGERLAAWISAFGLFLLTFFPVRTELAGEASLSNIRNLDEMIRPFWGGRVDEFVWFECVNIFHFGGAAFLFGALIYQSAVIFTRWGPKDRESQFKANWKYFRNFCYYTLTAIMVLALVFTFNTAPGTNAFFWGEVVALAAFAASWFLKGRGLITIYLGRLRR